MATTKRIRQPSSEPNDRKHKERKLDDASWTRLDEAGRSWDTVTNLGVQIAKNSETLDQYKEDHKTNTEYLNNTQGRSRRAAESACNETSEMIKDLQKATNALIRDQEEARRNFYENFGAFRKSTTDTDTSTGHRPVPTSTIVPNTPSTPSNNNELEDHNDLEDHERSSPYFEDVIPIVKTAFKAGVIGVIIVLSIYLCL